MIKHNKYIRILFISLVICFFTTFSGITDVNKPVIINALMPAPFADSTKELVDDFNKAHRGTARLIVTRGPRETESVSDMAISNMLLGSSPFDLLLIDVTWLPKYAAAGWLYSLDEKFGEEELSSLVPGSRAGNSYNGSLYRWPLVADIGLLYWRKDLMKSPPKTPEELIRISKDIQSQNLVSNGYVWQGRQYEGLSCVFLEMLNAYGGVWLDKENNPKLNSIQSQKAAKWLKELIVSGVSPKAVTNFSENETLQVFESGNAAMMRNWPYAWTELQKPSSPVKGIVGVTTMVAEPNQTPTATLGSWGLSILKTSPNKKEALEAISFLTSESAQKKLFLNNGYTPTKASLFKDKELNSLSPILPEIERALELSKPRPQTALYAQISDVLQRELSSFLTGQKELIEAMDSAQEITKNILRSAGKIT